MKKLIFTIIILMVTLTSFPNKAAEENDLRKKVEKLNEKFVNAIIDDDLESYLSIYDDDAIVMLPFMDPIKGKHALTVHWHNKMAKGELTESASVIIEDLWSSGNKVYERGSFQITFQKHLNNPRAIYGSYFTIWEIKPDGSLKIKYDISNLDHKI